MPNNLTRDPRPNHLTVFARAYAASSDDLIVAVVQLTDEDVAHLLTSIAHVHALERRNSRVQAIVERSHEVTFYDESGLRQMLGLHSFLGCEGTDVVYHLQRQRQIAEKPFAVLGTLDVFDSPFLYSEQELVTIQATDVSYSGHVLRRGALTSDLLSLDFLERCERLLAAPEPA